MHEAIYRLNIRLDDVEMVMDPELQVFNVVVTDFHETKTHLNG